MLYLSRKLGESIVINNSIELTVIEVRGKTVKLGFVFPPDATVLRKEITIKLWPRTWQQPAAAMLISSKRSLTWRISMPCRRSEKK